MGSLDLKLEAGILKIIKEGEPTKGYIYHLSVKSGDIELKSSDFVDYDICKEMYDRLSVLELTKDNVKIIIKDNWFYNISIYLEGEPVLGFEAEYNMFLLGKIQTAKMRLVQ